jgi:hypothetical protein
MKALTLTQPWATLVGIGAKRVETRSWTTRYRGPLAIHAAKGKPRYDLLYEEPFRQALFGDVWYPPRVTRESLPLGAIVAVASLESVRRIEADGIPEGPLGLTLLRANEHEEAFGDYTPGRYAWVLRSVRALPEPIECRGALGLWDVPADLLPLIESRARGPEAASTTEGTGSFGA